MKLHPVQDMKNTFKLTLPDRKPEKPLASKKEVKRYATKSGLGNLFGILLEAMFWWR